MTSYSLIQELLRMRAPDADIDPGSSGLYNTGLDRAIAIILQHDAERTAPRSNRDKNTSDNESSSGYDRDERAAMHSDSLNQEPEGKTVAVARVMARAGGIVPGTEKMEYWLPLGSMPHSASAERF